MISIHALTGSATTKRKYRFGSIIRISIHALTGSATQKWNFSPDSYSPISIHALTGSATHDKDVNPDGTKKFQFMHSQGVQHLLRLHLLED